MEYSTSSITLSVTGIHHSTKICRTNSYIGQKIDQFSDQQVQGQGPLILTKNSIKSLHVISFFHFLSIFFIPVKENLEFVLVSQIFTVVFQFFSHCLTLCEPMDCSTPVFLFFPRTMPFYVDNNLLCISVRGNSINYNDINKEN